MGGDILVDVSQFSQTRRTLLDCYTNFDSVLTSFKLANDGLAAEWKGIAGASFESAAETLQEAMKASNKQLLTMIQQMDLAEKGVSELDAELARLVNDDT